MMRTTVTIDDQLMFEAQRITGVNEKAVLVREGLKALIERESSRRLAALGASEPDLEAAPRRRGAEDRRAPAFVHFSWRSNQDLDAG
jgi:Arc/MetJ family transcription regulator